MSETNVRMTNLFDRLLSMRYSQRDDMSILRESFFKPNTPIDDLLEDAHDEHFTGQIILDLKNGDVNGIRLRDEMRLPPFTFTKESS